MILRKLLVLFFGGTYGFLSAAGVFTILLTVGLVPRFAGRTHTAERIYLYEETVIWGTVFGGFVSVFEELCHVGGYLRSRIPSPIFLWEGCGQAVLTVAGLLAGIFVGCLAMAIAEMLDSIPIFSRRVSLTKGFRYVVLSMAAGKMTGALFYFASEFYRTAG